MTKKEKPIEPKKGAPAYLVSFGDMMTLILCFFILLVSLSSTQDFGLTAKGIGSFITAVKSFGLSGILDAAEKQAIFEHQRRKFNVPPEEDEERLVEVDQASSFELIKTKLLKSLEPHDELTYPSVVEFAADSAEIPPASLPYLRRLGPSLKPKFKQTLLIEGHANDAGSRFMGDNRRLATSRANAVRRYLIEEFGFEEDRVQARAWNTELPSNGQTYRSVDVRLVTPQASPADK